MTNSPTASSAWSISLPPDTGSNLSTLPKQPQDSTAEILRWSEGLMRSVVTNGARARHLELCGSILKNADLSVASSHSFEASGR